MDWNVKNAVNRDVERQHLNKILAEIRASIDEVKRLAETTADADAIKAIVGTMVSTNTETGLTVNYNTLKKVLDFAVSNFTLTLTGDITGTGTIQGLSNATIITSLSGSAGIEDVPLDNVIYWRLNQVWEAVSPVVVALGTLLEDGLIVSYTDSAGDVQITAREIEGATGQIDVADGDGAAGNPTISLADVIDSNTGTLQGITVDGKGRVTGTTDATITAGIGIDVVNGDAASGPPTISHEDTSAVTDLNSNNSGTVVLQDITITFDTFGHVLTATVGTVDVAAALSGTYQPLDATLTALAANNWVLNAFPIGTGADTVAQVSFAANTFPARGSTGNLVAKTITDDALLLLADADVPRLGTVNTWSLSQTFSASQIFSSTGATFLRTDTADASDTASLILDATSGTLSNTRGAYVRVNGNEASSNPGSVVVISGNNADIIFSGGTLRPNATITYDFGSSTFRWNDGYLETINLGDTHTPINATAEISTARGSDNTFIESTVASATASHALRIAAYRARGTLASPSAVQDNDFLGVYNWLGYNNGAYQLGANMAVLIDGTPGATNIPTQIIFSTATASAAATNRWTIRASGDLEPIANNSYNVGGSSVRVATTYSTHINLNGTEVNLGIISPAQITANQNDYAPTGHSTTRTFRLNLDAARTITGLQGGTDGRRITISNISAFGLTLAHDSASSTAANRILCPNSTLIVIRANGAVDLWYDGTSSRWRVISV